MTYQLGELWFNGVCNSWRSWSCGIGHSSSKRTSVLLIGTNWKFGIAREGAAFAVMFGPFALSTARAEVL